MKKTALLLSLALGCSLVATSVSAFCGFYVAQADADLFNNASKVVLVRDGNRTTLTMASDYEGDLKEFAAVFPVPVVLKEKDIRVVDSATIDHLDRYTAPRLVEYHDNPCPIPESTTLAAVGGAFPGAPAEENSIDLGVVIEAQYQIEEYDILILSARESSGLETWLKQNGYQIPDGASEVLGSYIKQKMKFFVAKVNMDKQKELGFSYLRPLRVSYETDTFMLPIRLGTVNAKPGQDQDLIAFVITRNGRVECANYKTRNLPSNLDVPLFVRDEFDDFYRDMFAYQHAKAKNSVFLEYGWNMSWCDPCAADPLSPEQLRELGCDWVKGNGGQGAGRFGKGGARDAYVTRLHARYNAKTFPEDLVLKNTGDISNFQGRYVLRNIYKGNNRDDEWCKEHIEAYWKALPKRIDNRIENLHDLTGWDLQEIRRKTYAALPAKLQTK